MSGEVTATALYAYDAGDSDELTVEKGDVLVLLESYDDGWWLMRKGDVTGLVPSNYMTITEFHNNEAVGKGEGKKLSNARNANDDQSRQKRRAHKSEHSTDLEQLKTLREEAEEKINALSMAVERSQEENTVHTRRLHSQPDTGEPKAEERGRSNSKQSTALVSAHPPSHRQLIPKGNLQQVSLDPSSLKFISDIITERINHEFALRDGRLMEKVKTMITSTTAPNSTSAIRYLDTGRNGQSGLMSEVGTPQRNSRPSLPHAISMDSGMSNSSLANGGKPGAHPSRIPVRVSLPKIASAIEFRTNAKADINGIALGVAGNPKAPLGSRSSNGAAPTRRQSLGNDSRLPHLAQGVVAASAQGAARVPRVSSQDEGAPHHHAAAGGLGGIIEPALDGMQYPQCRSKVYGPSFSVDAPDPLPGAKLALHHVYGYDGDLNRHGSAVRGKNVLWVDARRVIYPAAAVVVVQEVSGDRRQGFFCGHSDDVTCVAVHPQRTVAASGQMGKDASVLVWDVSKIKRGMSSNRTVAKLKPPTAVRGITAVDFSGDGRLLLGVGLDESRLLMVFDWREGTMVASAKIGHSDLNQVRFNPFLYTSPPPTTAADPSQQAGSQKNAGAVGDAGCRSCYTLVSFGAKNIKFWTLKEQYVKEENGLESISTFKGRPLNRRKGDQGSTLRFVLEGNLGAVNSKGNAPPPDYTSMVMVNDVFGTDFPRSTPKSRIFFGTAAGSIYIWQQLEDDGLRASLEKVNNAGPAGLLVAPSTAWQPRGKLLSVVMELHDAPIIDMDYIRVTPAQDLQSPTERSGPGRIDISTERIITSSADGIVNVWMLSRHEGTSNALPLDHLGYIELNKEYARTVSWDPTGTAAILGTAENSVLLLGYEEEQVVSTHRGKKTVGTEDLIRPKIVIDVVTQAHNGKVRKLSVNTAVPSLVATVSSERVVRLWDFRDRVLLSSFEVSEAPTAVAFAPGGDAIALGTEKGEFAVYTCAALQQLVRSYPCAFTVHDFAQAEWTVSFQRSLGKAAPEIGTPSKKKPAHLKKMEICEIVFSPAGDVVALACKDNLVHLLSVINNYKYLAVCRGHSAYVRTMDFSRDGAVLQTSDASRELMHWDAATGKRLLNAAHFRDEAWSTYTSVYGWSVQGVFNNGDGVAAVDGEINSVDRSADGRWLVSGGSHTVHSAIKLFNYPCLSDAVPSVHGGHTSPVVDVKILQGGDGALEVASAGGNDTCVFQWRLLEYK